MKLQLAFRGRVILLQTHQTLRTHVNLSRTAIHGIESSVNAYLLYTRDYQPPLLIPNPLHDQPSPLTRPRRLHLGTHPLIGLDFPRPMEVYCMIQAYHDANRAIGCLERILRAWSDPWLGLRI